MLWKNPLRQEKNYDKAIYWSLLITLLSLAFSIRFINSISVFVLVAFTLIHPDRKRFFKAAFRNPYFIACIALFLTKAMGLFYTGHFNETWKQIGGKIIWMAIPFFFCANKCIAGATMQRLLFYFSLSLFVVSVYCLLHAFSNYSQHHDPSAFFYHPLVQPAKHHAIFFSFYLFFCIVYWMEEGLVLFTSGKMKTVLICLVIFFHFFIILLSSKLVIAAAVLYLILFGARYLWIKKTKAVVVLFISLVLATASLLLATKNPVKDRFRDLTNGSIGLFTQQKFSPGVYFNGLQFRLLIWRFTYEILNEKKAWVLGVSSGDAQYELDRKYIEANVYQGNGQDDSKGYLLFNCHNVFLQTVLESGLMGLVALIAVISTLIIQIVRRRRRSTFIFFMAILAFCFTESVLTSQYTILLFMFFPLLSLSKCDKD